MQFLIEKISIFFSCNFFYIFGHQTLDLDPDPDPDPHWLDVFYVLYFAPPLLFCARSV
jgi:hypothetical protein